MLKQNKKRNTIMIFLLLAYMTVHVIYTKIFLHLFDMPMQFSVIFQMTSYIVLGGVGAVLFWAEIKEGIALWREYPVKNGTFFLGTFILDILLSNLAYLPIMYLNPDYQSVNEHSVAELQGKFPALFLIIALGVMGPVTEEVIFRFMPICLTEKKMKKMIGVLVSAIVFMLIHINGFTAEEFLYYIPMFVTGVIYGIVTVISRNVTIPMLLHIMNNLPAILFGIL